MNMIDHLERSKLFDQLSEEEITLFMEKFKKMSLKTGDYVFKETEIGDTLYIVENGTVSMIKSIVGDVEKKIFVAQKGLIFGEFSFMDGGVRSASAIAEEDSDLLYLERKDFNVFIQENPSAGAKLFANMLNIVVERLRSTNEAYKDAIRWGVELTGTPALNFHYLITEDVDVCIELTTNRMFEGKVISLERSDAGYQVIMMDRDGNPAIIPYHAVVSVTIAK